MKKLKAGEDAKTIGLFPAFVKNPIPANESIGERAPVARGRVKSAGRMIELNGNQKIPRRFPETGSRPPQQPTWSSIMERREFIRKTGLGLATVAGATAVPAIAQKLYKNSVARMQAFRPKSGGFLDFTSLHPGYTLFNSIC